MTMHPGENRLNDWLDGDLDAVGAAEVAAHVDGCAACRGTADALRSIVAAAARLDHAIEPRHDLWGDIDTRIDRARATDLAGWRARRFADLWPHRYQIAAAATLLVLVASTGSFLLLRDGGPATAAADVDQHPIETAPVRLVSLPGESDYAAAIEELDMLLSERRDRMDPQTLAVVERNMAIIDQAIRESQNALAADPANGDLNRAVSSAYKTKINLLRRAVHLPART